MKGALIGEKLSHSFSAEIHKQLGVDYSLVQLKKEEISAFVKDCNLDFFNVTIPYKKEIIQYLDFVDSASEKIGAVNTVIIKDGKKFGYNTDYYGFKLMLEKNKIVVNDKNVLILGTGGTKETVSCVLKDLGAKKIIIVSRNGEINYTNCYFQDVEVIVNTTPVGMYPNFEMVNLDLTRFKNLYAVVDCIYNPLKTKLILQAEKLNIQAVSGLYMLVAQAVHANLLINKKISASIVDKIYKDLLFKKQNIVLVGMPGCGKSTIGKLLSKKLDKCYVDTDNLIELENGKIVDIFKIFGEDKFREIETKVVLKVSKENGKIISTGGGVVLKEENVESLKHNSIIIYIKRDVNLLKTDGRPLSKNLDNLISMQKIREPLYNKCADIIVENNNEINVVLDKIVEEIKKWYSL